MTINLIHGDCLVEMQNIPDKSIDMICADLLMERLLANGIVYTFRKNCGINIEGL
jgi:predicted methyltransferase